MYVNVSASDSSTKVTKGKPDTWQSNVFYVYFDSYNYCENSGKFHYGSQPFPGFKGNLLLKGATIDLNMEACSYKCDWGSEEEYEAGMQTLLRRHGFLAPTAIRALAKASTFTRILVMKRLSNQILS
jgi:hypothetical protein